MCKSQEAIEDAIKRPGLACDTSIAECPYEKETKSESDAVVYFRPTKGWKGEFGIDWFRDGNWALSNCNNINANFNDNVGKLWIPAAEADITKQKVNPDGNSYDGKFRKNDIMIKNLKNDYGFIEITHSDKSKTDSITSHLSVYINDSAKANPKDALPKVIKIVAVIKVIAAPDEFKLIFDNSYLDITALPVASGEHELTITIKKALESDQVVLVKAIKEKLPDQVVGKLHIRANSKAKRKKKKLLLISVKTPEISSGAGEKKGNTSGKFETYKKILNQSLIEPTEEIIDLDVTKDPNILSKYVKDHKLVFYNYKDTTLTDMHTYLYEKLKAELKAKNPAEENKYNNHFKVFYFNESGGYIKSDGLYYGLNGYSLGKFIVITPDSNDGTASHELLHSLGLPHTFTGDKNEAKYTYYYATTENIMDYTHHKAGSSNARCATYKWQWEIANANGDPDTD
ncbi:MAG: hypothetical protein IPH46_10675 [Bacteroidetes bacterium]|nr:hypothetical protein [Bacteroidota bacterium]